MSDAGPTATDLRTDTAPDAAGGASPRELLGLTAWWVASVLVAVAHNGLWATPNLESFSIAADRFGTSPFASATTNPGDYILTDVSLTGLAHVLAQTTPHAFARMHLVLMVLGWGGLVLLTWRRWGPAVARTLTVLLAVSPIVTVSMQWLGQPDPFTAGCGIAMVLVRRRWAVLTLGVLAGLTHPEQAVVMVIAAAAVVAALPESEGRGRTFVLTALAAVGGVLLGRAITELWFRLNDITIQRPRTAYLELGASTFAEHHAQQPLGLLWTLWGPLWLVLAGLAAVAVARRRDPATRQLRTLWIAVGVIAVAALVPVAVTLDETRVYAVITAPLLVALAVAATQLLDRRALLAASVATLLVGVVVPGGFATGVTSWRSQLDTATMATFLVSGDQPDGSPALTFWLLSPFDFTIPTVPSGS
ncbi:MAG: hypothetical protein ACOYML_10915 [Microthrixaceae bacterium]